MQDHSQRELFRTPNFSRPKMLNYCHVSRDQLPVVSSALKTFDTMNLG